MTAVIDRFFSQYRFLSNFWPVMPRTVYLPDEPDLWYRSVEHAYQASKHRVSSRKLFHTVVDPSIAKEMGGQATIDHQRRNRDIMILLLQQKFKEPYLRILLLRTQDAKLIEGNTWHDNYWGDCRCNRCERIEGHNHLGFLLELVRWQILHPENLVDGEPKA